MWEKVQESVQFIKNKITNAPEIGMILGSGLGNLVEDIQIQQSIDYSEIPHFPLSTVAGHQGKLIFGTLSGKSIVAMQGRFHYYEGYDMKQVTFPVRVMKYLGIQLLVVSNASGGVHPEYKVGDIVAITDHINMFPEHPLRGTNDERFGPRFLNMSEPYDAKYISLLEEVAKELKIHLKKGIYYGLSGPTFETMAEYEMIRSVGADCVGMSTVPEVIVARHMNVKCVGLSVISDVATHDGIELVAHEEVLKAVQLAEPKMRQLINCFVSKL